MLDGPKDYDQTAPIGHNLPPLPFWAARSFYLTLVAVIAPILSAVGIDWPWVSDPATIDAIMQVVGGISAVLAWRERLSPTRRLTA